MDKLEKGLAKTICICPDARIEIELVIQMSTTGHTLIHVNLLDLKHYMVAEGRLVPVPGV
jgi:hypothetical protein